MAGAKWCIMLYFAGPAGDCCTIFEPRLNEKPRDVHLYCTLMACGDCGGTTQKGYVEILEFTQFVEFFSFNKIGENHREKELVRKVTVVVALDLGCGNTKNSEYESK